MPNDWEAVWTGGMLLVIALVLALTAYRDERIARREAEIKARWLEEMTKRIKDAEEGRD